MSNLIAYFLHTCIRLLARRIYIPRRYSVVQDSLFLQENWGIEPLLKIDLEFADGHVVCRPSLEETSQVLSAQLDEMAHRLTDVQDDCLGCLLYTSDAADE